MENKSSMATNAGGVIKSTGVSLGQSPCADVVKTDGDLRDGLKGRA